MKALANELRIGNQIQAWTGEIVNVSAKDIYDIANGFHDPNKFSNIPLTEAKLLELGFEKLKAWDDMDIYRNGKIDIEVNNLGFYFDETKVESVHHLQNIYHSLTGEELTPITK